MFVAIAVAVAFAIYASTISATDGGRHQQSHDVDATSMPVCGRRTPSGTKSLGARPTKSKSSDVFRGMSEGDFKSVENFLLSRQELNITVVASATKNSNYIFMIEDYLPPKNDVLAYLDGRISRSPPRRAKVVIFNGATVPKGVKEYIVSPVPNPTTISPFGDNTIPWKVRPVDDTVEMQAIANFLYQELQPLQELLQRSFGQWVGPDCGDKCLFFAPMPRAGPASDYRYLYVIFFLNADSVEGNYLYPVPLQLLLREADQYAIAHVYYDHRRFDSVTALLDAVASKTIEPVKPFDVEPLRKRYSSPHRRGEDFNVDGLKPPVHVLPDGPRYAIDERHINYLGWSFDLFFRTSTGLALHNIVYNGHRIAYEIGMQDIAVLYGGVPPFNFFQSVFDNGFSLGNRNLPLVRGADCPSDAAYLDNYVLTQAHAKPRWMKDAVCVFEQRNAVPLRRHYSENFFDGSYNYAFSMPDNVLIVRQILTIFNYDYIFDYELHQNGVIETRVSSTGYIIVTNALNRHYGYPIEDSVRTLANVHLHLFNFRYDLDVGGRRNRLTMMKFELENTTIPVITDSFKQLVVKEQTARTEQESLVHFNFSKPQYYTIQSDDQQQRSANGQPKGYRIQSSHFAHVLLPDTNPQMKGASWAKTQLAVTKYKDSERGTASIYTQGDPSEPVMNFENFFADDEPIVGEDLVAWATVGMHHIPSLEDVPVTTTPGRQLSIGLVPFNFFDEDPSMSSRDAFVVLRGEGGRPNIISYLHASSSCLATEGNVTLSV